MSAEIVITNNTAAKVKKITLAGKYTKFLVFGHWFIQHLNADETVTAAARDTLLMFASPEQQNQMFDSFFNDLKTSTNEMKALIKQHNKPPAKPKKEKKVKDQSDKTTKPKPKGKKTTEIHTDPQDALVAEIVAAAQTDILPGDLLKTVLRKGQGAAAPLRPPATEDMVEDANEVSLGESNEVQEEPTKKKKVVKKAPESDSEKEAKELLKAAEKEAKEAAKAAEKEAKEAAKAAEKLLKEAEKEAKEAAKAAEKKAKDAEKLVKAAEKKDKPVAKKTKAKEDEIETAE